MANLYDYFRAADDEAVAKLMQAARGDSPVTRVLADGVDAAGIEPAVTLGKLIAYQLGISWSVDLTNLEEVWWDDDDGPWVVLLEGPVVDSLARTDDGQLPELAAWWSQIDEMRNHNTRDTAADHRRSCRPRTPSSNSR